MCSTFLCIALMLQSKQLGDPGDKAIMSELFLAGNEYVYQVGDSKKVTLTYRVKSVSSSKKGERKIAAELVLHELGVSAPHDILITGAAVKSIRPSGAQEVLFPLPLKPGEKWESTRKFGNDEIKEIRTVKGTERLDTPIGKVDAIRVDFKSDSYGETITGSQWYAPDGGLIKSEGYVGDLTLIRVKPVVKDK